MKLFSELTRSGRLRRMRSLARSDLPRYGLDGAPLTFVHYEGNAVFRIEAAPAPEPREGRSRTAGKRYALRIHATRSAERIESELAWLATLRREAGLPVPEPLAASDGKLPSTVSMPGGFRLWHVSVMRWLEGRRMAAGFTPAHARAWGRTLGRLHRFAAGWQAPKGFTRPYLGWSGLYGRDGGLWYPAEELADSMPRKYREALFTVTREVRTVMEAMGEGPDVFGMVHGDMYLENVVFRAGTVCLIDFDDCGFGYWLYDIGVALSQWPWTARWFPIRDALVEGYAETHSLPEAHLEYLDVFMAAQYAVLTLWGAAFIKSNPGMRAEHERWRNRGGDNLLRYLALR